MDNPEKISLSFVVIAYNEEKRIASTISSLLSQDTSTVFEIIVVDDGSTDRTDRVSKEILSAFSNHQVISFATNQGRGAARLEGQKRAIGNYIAFVDSDVVLPSNWVERTCNEIESKDLDAVSGVAIPDGDCVVISRIARLNPKIRGGSAALTGNNLMIKKDVIAQVPFQNLPYGDDIRLAWDLERKGYKTKSLKDLIVKHSESKSFRRTVVWQYQQGKEATSLLWDYRKLRIPDIAWLGTATFPILSSIIFNEPSYLVKIVLSEIAYCIVVSTIFLVSRFNLKARNVRTYSAIGVNFIFMMSYFVGRYRGMLSIKHREMSSQ